MKNNSFYRNLRKNVMNPINDVNPINNASNAQNISELFKTRQIGLFLRSVLDDIEVYIYPKTLKIYMSL